MYRYWIGTAEFHFIRAIDCDGNPIPYEQQTEGSSQRTLTVWAQDAHEAEFLFGRQFWDWANRQDSNPIVNESVETTVRQMYTEEIEAMHALWNK